MIKPIKEEFPYDTFPWKLEYMDGKDNRLCFFENEYYRQKHINRYNLNKKEIKLSCKYEV
jgi:hypothetical protein